LLKITGLSLCPWGGFLGLPGVYPKVRGIPWVRGITWRRGIPWGTPGVGIGVDRETQPCHIIYNAMRWCRAGYWL